MSITFCLQFWSLFTLCTYKFEEGLPSSSHAFLHKGRQQCSESNKHCGNLALTHAASSFVARRWDIPPFSSNLFQKNWGPTVAMNNQRHHWLHCSHTHHVLMTQNTSDRALLSPCVLYLSTPYLVFLVSLVRYFSFRKACILLAFSQRLFFSFIPNHMPLLQQFEPATAIMIPISWGSGDNWISFFKDPGLICAFLPRTILHTTTSYRQHNASSCLVTEGVNDNMVCEMQLARAYTLWNFVFQLQNSFSLSFTCAGLA